MQINKISNQIYTQTSTSQRQDNQHSFGDILDHFSKEKATQNEEATSKIEQIQSRFEGKYISFAKGNMTGFSQEATMVIDEAMDEMSLSLEEQKNLRANLWIDAFFSTQLRLENEQDLMPGDKIDDEQILTRMNEDYQGKNAIANMSHPQIKTSSKELAKHPYFEPFVEILNQKAAKYGLETYTLYKSDIFA